MPDAVDIYGLLGYPVSHSFSPAMHNAAFKALSLNAEYRLFEVSRDDLSGFFPSIRQKGIRGFNITIPYKEKVFAYLDTVTKAAQLIGAVNTVKVTPAGLEAHNTDAEGFLMHLSEQLGFSCGGKRVALLGAGGAAKAVAVALCRSGIRSLRAYDIDSTKVTSFLRHLREHFPSVEILQAGTIEQLDTREADLLINATPIGMNPLDPCLVDPSYLNERLLVYDLIYTPRETALLKRAREKGARVSNGLGMLLYQGMIAFEIWTGCPAPKTVMQRALEGQLS